MPEEKPSFTWKFQRLGGLDQVTLRTPEELGHLGRLDPKLWVALSCPASGLEFDQRTLTLLDTDDDGRIRLPEVEAAVEWACARLADPADLINPREAMPLTAIKSETEEGARLLASARAVLQGLDRPDDEELRPDEVSQAAATASRNLFNGDGILPVHEGLEPDIRRFIEDALAVVGGVRDASGEPGVNKELIEAFLQSLRDWRDWKGAVSDAASPLGDNTPEVGELLLKLKPKLDDYFLRCDLASFAPQSAEALNTDETLSQAVDHGLVNLEYLTGLPLAHVEAERPLGLSRGLNPAWRKDLTRFFQLTEPLRAQAEALTRDDWRNIQNDFSAYASALNSRPAPVRPEVEYAPTISVEELGAERVQQILDGDLPDRLQELLARDDSAPGASTEVAALERLVLYYRHLYHFLMNFVSFYDFYTDHDATFQTGTLFLDGRSCGLCLPVDDVTRHSALAAHSQLCLIYCVCRRRQKPGLDQSEETINIVAAVTAGASDLLMEGRNGIYVDSQHQDWDATIVKLVANPIDLKQAVWEPYRKLGRLISAQVDKFAGGKNEEFINAASQKISASVIAPPATAPAAGTAGTSFDIARSAGIFAAIGLALGAIGTALAAIARAFFALTWYEVPLVFLGLFLIISGPSVILAWLKLRKRTIGPLLEASGWAVNSRVPINLALGRKLTNVAVLPPNSTRDFKDPLKPPRGPFWPILIIVAVIIGTVCGWLWVKADHQPGSTQSEAAAAAPAADSPAVENKESKTPEAGAAEETGPATASEPEAAAEPAPEGGQP